MANTAERISAILDVEVTNKCNAHCIMCPREKTPAQGLMAEATFRQVIKNAREYGRVDQFVFAGLGEPLLHPDIVTYVKAASDAGFKPGIVTNASLLKREIAEALVRSGLKEVNVSIGGFTRAAYERVQRGLKFDAVYRNLIDFLEVAGGQTSLNVQVSPTEESIREAEQVAAFWRAKGAKLCFFFPFAASRGGAFSEEKARSAHCQTQTPVRLPKGCISVNELFRPSRHDWRIMHRRAAFVCYPKDRVTFISWQGNYQVCCNDYEKKHVLGNVFEMSLEEVYLRKARLTPQNSTLCAACNVKGDLAPRDARLYVGAGLYLLASRVAALRGGKPHPEFASAAPVSGKRT